MSELQHPFYPAENGEVVNIGITSDAKLASVHRRAAAFEHFWLNRCSDRGILLDSDLYHHACRRAAEWMAALERIEDEMHDRNITIHLTKPEARLV